MFNQQLSTSATDEVKGCDVVEMKLASPLDLLLQVTDRMRATDEVVAGGASMANHASTRTTQLYDRRSDDVTLDEAEGIIFLGDPNINDISPS